MKTIRTLTTLTIGLLFAGFSMAQNIDDAIRYSKHDISGTARYTAMSGAFGALGGDLTSISDNPGALGTFMYSEINLTPTFNFTNSQTNFLGQTQNAGKLNLNFNNFSFVLSMKTPNGKLKAFNLAFSYKRMDNFTQRIYAEGFNNVNSITDYLADRAYGNTLSSIDDGTVASDLVYNAYNTYLINPVNNVTTNIEYESALDNYGQLQKHTITTKGKQNEYVFAAGGNYNDKLYFGANLSYLTVSYNQNSELIEKDEKNIINNFNELNYSDYFETSGYGYRFKMGLIYKATQWLRFGTAFQTPSIYHLTDDYGHTVSSSIIPPNENAYKPFALQASGNYGYDLMTPMKLMGSLGFVIKKKATIGLEYELLDYTMANFDKEDDGSAFIAENNLIEESLKPAHNVKLGMEVRHGILSIRTGVAYLDSPYKSDQINKDAYTINYSGGFGLNFNNFYVDFAYAYAYNNYYYYPYTLDLKPVQAYKIYKNTSKFVTTIGIRL